MDMEMVTYRYRVDGKGLVLGGMMPLNEALEVIADAEVTEMDDGSFEGFPVRADNRWFPESVLKHIKKGGKREKSKNTKVSEQSDEEMGVSENTEKAESEAETE